MGTMYPNPRINQRERDAILFGSLGNKPIDTSAIAEAPGESRVDQLAREFKDIRGKGRAAAVAEAGDREEADSAWGKSGGLSPSGRVYVTPRVPMDDDTDSILSGAARTPAGQQINDILAAKKPTRVSSGDSITGYGQPELEAAPPIERSEEDVYKMKRIADRQHGDRIASLPTGVDGKPLYSTADDRNFRSQSELDSFLARSEEQKAAGDQRNANVAHNAQAEAVMRRMRLAGTPMNPAMASLFVGAGLNRPDAGTDSAAGSMLGGMNQMNKFERMLNPKLAEAEMQANGGLAAANARNGVDMKRLANEETEGKRRALGAWASMEIARMDQQIAQANADQKPQLIAARDAFRQRIAADGFGINPSDYGIDSPAEGPEGPAGSPKVPAMPVSTGGDVQDSPHPAQQPNVGEMGSFPAVGRAEDLATAAAGFKPNFSDATGIPFAKDALSQYAGKQYVPTAPWNDVNKNGLPEPGEFANANDQRHYTGQHYAKQIHEAISSRIKDLVASGASDPRQLYAALQPLIARHGEDAVRVAMAEKFNAPEWLSNHSSWKHNVLDPAQPSLPPEMPWSY